MTNFDRRVNIAFHTVGDLDPDQPQDQLLGEHPKLAAMYAYWNRKRGQRRLPGRPDIDPIEMREFLSNLLLAENPPGSNDWRFRVYGTALAEKQGFDLTGKLMSQHPDPDHAARVNRVLCHIRREGKPWMTRDTRIVNNKPWRYAALFLPLSTDGTHVNMILGGVESEV